MEFWDFDLEIVHINGTGKPISVQNAKFIAHFIESIYRNKNLLFE